VAWSYRGNFESINEVQGGVGGPYYFPPIHYDDLVGEWAWIDLKVYSGDAWEGQKVAYSDMEVCDRGDEPGRWVQGRILTIFRGGPISIPFA